MIEANSSKPFLRPLPWPDPIAPLHGCGEKIRITHWIGNECLTIYRFPKGLYNVTIGFTRLSCECTCHLQLGLKAYCIEHDLLLKDGTCSTCRDQNGNPFILDMQSTYLQRPPVGLDPWIVRCGICHCVNPQFDRAAKEPKREACQ